MTRNNSAFDRYLSDISDYGRITPAREAELSAVILNDPNEEQVEAATNELVHANLLLVIHCLKEFGKFINSPAVHITEMDLIAEGNIGLMNAAQRFNATYASGEGRQSVRFSTYACKCIKSRMRRALKLARFIHIPEHHFGYWTQIEKMRSEHGDALSDDMLRDHLDVSDDVLRMLKQSESSRTFMLEDMSSDNDEGYWQEVLPNEKAPCPNLEAETSDMKGFLISEMERLPERTRSMISIMFFDDAAPTLREMSSQFGVSSERCRQVCAQGLTELRRQLSPRWERVDPKLAARQRSTAMVAA